MPNWCLNDMQFHAESREELDQLLSEITRDEEKRNACFGKLLADYDPNREDWYDWNVKNIGTKWEPSDFDYWGPALDDKARGPRKWKLEVAFSSAWSPPLAIMPTIARKFPKIKFSIRYDESGMCFRGHQWWNNGKMTKDSYTDY